MATKATGKVKKAAQKAPEKAPEQPLAVPAMRATSADPADLLAQVSGLAPVEQPKPQSGQRVQMKLTPEIEEAVREWVPANIVGKHFETACKNASAALDTLCFEQYIDAMWAAKNQPTNPKLVVSRDRGGKSVIDMEALFQVQQKYQVQVKTADELVKVLVEQGVAEADVRKMLAAGEIDFTPNTGLRSFRELVKGHYEGKELVESTPEEKAAGQKLLKWVLGQQTEPLTDDERKLVIRNEPDIKVKDGFLVRVASYVQTRDQLAAVLQVMKPTHFPCHAKFGINDDLAEKNARLIEAASDILGTSLGVDSGDEEK